MVSNPEKDRVLHQEAITCAKSLKGPETPVALAATTTTSPPQAVTAAADDGGRQLSVDSEISGTFRSENLKAGVKHVSAEACPAAGQACFLQAGFQAGETCLCTRATEQRTAGRETAEARSTGGADTERCWCVSHRRKGEEQRAAKPGGKGDVAGLRPRASVPQKQQPSLRRGTWGLSTGRGGLAEPGDGDGTRGAQVNASLTKQLWAVFRDCVAAVA